MRERNQQSLGGHVLYVGLFRHPGMLHRAKYSRFRNDSITSLDEGTQNTSLNIKGSSSSSHSSTPNLLTEDVSLGTQDTCTTLCALIPRMANIKLANPSNLPGLKSFCLGTKEVPRIKLTECVTIPSSPASPEISCLSASYPQPDLDKLLLSTKAAGDGTPWGSEEAAPAGRQDRSLIQNAENVVEMGTTYCVRYMGCIEVLQSMRSLDFGTRTQVTREAISRLCEAVSGTNGAIKKRKPPVKFLSSVLGKSNLQFSGMNIKLTISTSSLTLVNVDTQQIIANHHMQSISFASGGDPDTTDYVAYVAKDPVNQRACHILECPNGMAQEVINTIGQAFELRFKQYLKNPSSLVPSDESEAVTTDRSSGNLQEREDHEYYNEIPGKEPPTGGVLDVRVKVQTGQRANCPIQCKKQYCLAGSPTFINIYENCPEESKTVGNGGERSQKTKKDATLLKPAYKTDLFDDPCYINTQTLQSAVCTARSTAAAQTHGSPLHHAKLPEAVQQSAASSTAGLCIMPQIKQQLKNEDCYHGKLNRKAAESLLVNDGDFLVRESTTSPGQYVLSGLQGGQAKHLLLVDPEGKVRTKDHIFDSVGHLIQYHMENNLPIISSGSEVSLKQPVRKESNMGHTHYHK
ncbi:SHC-transforming protein 4 isoform X1 [Apteryx mantelli]|uniref:SHC-transforming protein 4 isoform X1 n=1 Tax=Apteryx mantelli TaxID=2696672 RepID=A0A8B7JNV7_9AVES|nr:PREDICTED: SHC-transforming protein 4 isoform X1 [Apteryx mantelli mantelli]XP_025916339.1 SHC-transforming protein 4 [Apteryx rowi]